MKRYRNLAVILGVFSFGAVSEYLNIVNGPRNAWRDIVIPFGGLGILALWWGVYSNWTKYQKTKDNRPFI